jgi:hypothetical protein
MSDLTLESFPLLVAARRQCQHYPFRGKSTKQQTTPKTTTMVTIIMFGDCNSMNNILILASCFELTQSKEPFVYFDAEHFDF